MIRRNVEVAPPRGKESLELFRGGDKAWNQAERAKITDLDWRIVADRL